MIKIQLFHFLLETSEITYYIYTIYERVLVGICLCALFLVIDPIPNGEGIDKRLADASIIPRSGL